VTDARPKSADAGQASVPMPASKPDSEAAVEPLSPQEWRAAVLSTFKKENCDGLDA
jgi:hypothetical protein